MYWIRSCPATGRQECDGTFARTPHSPQPDIYEYMEERRVCLRNTADDQQGAAIRDRSLADTTSVTAAVTSGDPIRRLLVSCWELGPCSAGGGQGGVASGRAFPSRCGFIVTNMLAGPEGVVRFYSGRGPAAHRGSRRASTS